MRRVKKCSEKAKKKKRWGDEERQEGSRSPRLSGRLTERENDKQGVEDKCYNLLDALDQPEAAEGDRIFSKAAGAQTAYHYHFMARYYDFVEDIEASQNKEAET